MKLRVYVVMDSAEQLRNNVSYVPTSRHRVFPQRVPTARHTSTNNLQDSKTARYGRLYAEIYVYIRTEIMRNCFNGQNNTLTTFLSILSFVTTDSKSIS